MYWTCSTQSSWSCKKTVEKKSSSTKSRWGNKMKKGLRRRMEGSADVYPSLCSSITTRMTKDIQLLNKALWLQVKSTPYKLGTVNCTFTFERKLPLKIIKSCIFIRLQSFCCQELPDSNNFYSQFKLLSLKSGYIEPHWHLQVIMLIPLWIQGILHSICRVALARSINHNFSKRIRKPCWEKNTFYVNMK